MANYKQLFIRFLKEYKLYNKYVSNEKRIFPHKIDKSVAKFFFSLSFDWYRSEEGAAYWYAINDVWLKIINCYE